jgi:hypothetical protein
MHNVPLIYFRSTKPLDVASLQQVKSMTAEREAHVTYPVFLKNKAGQLVFRYRDGGSGNGDDLYNVYDEKSGAWSKLIEGPLITGEGERSAYAIPPKQSPDGRFHLLWVWRDTPDCATNHSLSYARSDDLVHWSDSSGKEVKLPITYQSAEMIDPVPPGGGLINMNRELGFDNARDIADQVMGMYEAGDFDVAHLFFSKFRSALLQEPTGQQIIPVAPSANAPVSTGAAVEYEPDEEAILADLLPRNITVQVFKGLLENAASEQGASMTAMDNATRNAGDLINKLTIQYNRSRQAAITTELIEIIAGAEAL